MSDFVTVITPAEALREVDATDTYVSAVTLEVGRSSLDGDTKRAFATWLVNWNKFRDDVRESWTTRFFSGAAISRDCETYRDQARDYSQRARATGAPVIAPVAPTIPGEGTSEIGGLVKWAAIGLAAWAVITVVRSTRE